MNRSVLMGLVVVAPHYACGQNGSVDLNVAVPEGGATLSGGQYVTTDGSSTLAIDSVEFVIQDVQVERTTGTCEPSYSGQDDDDCEEFGSGPYVFDLPLDGSTFTLVSGDIHEGSYEELEFNVFDALVVTGTFDGAAFTYQANLNERLELVLTRPLVVDEQSAGHTLELAFDVSSWFVDGSGQLIDPRTVDDSATLQRRVIDNVVESMGGTPR